jgi:hypothetical protein
MTHQNNGPILRVDHVLPARRCTLAKESIGHAQTAFTAQETTRLSRIAADQTLFATRSAAASLPAHTLRRE